MHKLTLEKTVTSYDSYLSQPVLKYRSDYRYITFIRLNQLKIGF